MKNKQTNPLSSCRTAATADNNNRLPVDQNVSTYRFFITVQNLFFGERLQALLESRRRASGVRNRQRKVPEGIECNAFVTTNRTLQRGFQLSDEQIDDSRVVDPEITPP